MPSPAAVKAWLLNLATQDAIDTVDPNTPNKLLYMPCFWGKFEYIQIKISMCKNSTLRSIFGHTSSDYHLVKMDQN